MVKRTDPIGRSTGSAAGYMIPVIVTLAMILLDQCTKYAARHMLSLHPVTVIPGIFELVYVENRGAAFGIMENQQWFFTAFALIVMIGCVIYYPRIRKERRYHALRLTCCLIFAGACGNMIDRLRLGYVIDFLYASFIDFPVFNIADIYVTGGCFLLLILICFVYREEEVLC